MKIIAWRYRPNLHISMRSFLFGMVISMASPLSGWADAEMSSLKILGAGVDLSLALQCVGMNRADIFLKIKYVVTCDSQFEGYDSVRGFVSSDDSPTKFTLDLYTYQNSTEISLGAPLPAGELRVARIIVPESQNHCLLEEFKAELHCENLETAPRTSFDDPQALAQMAIRHAPFINLRQDQYSGESLSDTPLLMTYSVVPGDRARKSKKILYTAFFSDEDSQQTSENVQAQMSRYGRTADIEWAYEIEFNSDFRILRRTFQGNMHRTYKFKGRYLPESNHPILYNISNNNIFSDRPKSSLQRENSVGHLLVPRYQLDPHMAREWVMFQEPWMFKVSWAEMVRSNRASQQIKPENQLFIFANQKYYQGRLDRSVELSGGDIWEEMKSTKRLGSRELVSKLRDDFWHFAQSYWKGQVFTSIPIGEKNLDQIESLAIKAKFRTHQASWIKKLANRGEAIRFFRLVPIDQTYVLRELKSIENLFYGEERTVSTSSPFSEELKDF